MPRILIAITALAAVPGHAADEQALHFVETERTLELTVPAGGVWLVIPRAGFVRLAPVESGTPGLWTFDVVNASRGIEIFGTFDGASRYPGLRGVWAKELQDLKIEEAAEPANVRFSTEDDWEVIHYEMARDGETTTCLRAQAVEGDVWIDIQVEVSGAGDAESRRTTALEVLRSLEIREEFSAG